MFKQNDDSWEIVMVWIIIFIIALFATLIIVVKKPKWDKIEKEKKIHRREWLISWSNDMQKHGIKSITFFMDIKNPINTNSRSGIWERVIRTYVNRKKANIDTLYGINRFVYKHCDNNYYMLIAAEVDMVRYEFGNNITTIERSFGVNAKSTNSVYIKDYAYRKLKHYLPKCWD